MSNSRGGLGTLEYVSVAGAVVGSVIAYFTRHAVFGLAPVSLSLVLNLINRRRLETFLDHNADTTTEVQQLRRDVTLLRTTNDKVTQDIQNLSQQQELAPNTALEGLHQQQEGLRLSLVPLQSRLDDLIQQFNHRPELEEIESLAIVIEALKQSIDQLPQSNQSVENSLAESPQTERIERLQKAIDLLHYQFNNRPELVELKSLSDVTEALQESIVELSNSQQSSVQEIQQQVASSLSQLSKSEQVERLQKALNLLEHQLERKMWELHQDWAAQGAEAENK